MQRVPFIGQSYEARSKTIDSERSINLYPELVEANDGKSKIALIGTPGRVLWQTLPKASIRGMWVVPGTQLGVTDRLFVVANNTLYECFQNATCVSRGTLLTVNGFVDMENNLTQLMITDGSEIYIFALSTFQFTITGTTTPTLPAGVTIVSIDTTNNATLCQVVQNTFIVVPENTTDDIGNPNSPLNGATCAFLDSYLITHQVGTPTFAVSDLANGLSWDGLDTAQKEGSPDQIVALMTAHRELVILGQYSTEVWYDAGNEGFPLSPVQGVFLEQGCAAPFSKAKIDNTIFWVGYDKKGWGVVYRLDGYAPKRISTHAIEKIINQLGAVPQCNTYCYQEDGHAFYVLNFPNATTTLVYDAATDMWHERRSIDFNGNLNRDRVGFHAFAFGQHLMGDYQNGNLYVSSLDFYDDAGSRMRRIRIAPHLHSNLNYTFFKEFQVDMEAGVGLDGNGADGNGLGTNPQAILKISNDGGFTFGNEKWAAIGKIGQKRARVRWTALGRARDRVYWFEIDEPVKVVLVDAYSDHEEGTS